MNQRYNDQETFIRGYFECALWSSTLGDDCGTPMDQDYTLDDLADETVEVMRADCADFYESNIGVLALYADQRSWDDAGHDFWLTRNGHGAGFWDRGLEDIGRTLSDRAHQCGESNLYIGDDQRIHVC